MFNVVGWVLRRRSEGVASSGKYGDRRAGRNDISTSE
jgi:hypothetical protein